MAPLTYVTDARGRAGAYKPGTEQCQVLPAPIQVLDEVEAFDTQQRPDGLHIVDTRTGHSFGIMASPAIAEDQLRALRRISL